MGGADVVTHLAARLALGEQLAEQGERPVEALGANAEEVAGVAGEQDDELGVAVELIGERFGELGDPLGHGAPSVGCLGAEERHRLLDETVRDGLEHRLLGREVVEEGGLTDPETIGDVLDASLGEALLPEQLQRGLGDRRSRGLLLLLAQPHRAVPPSPIFL